LTAVVVDDELIIVVGGDNNCAEMYSMTNTWTKIPFMSTNCCACVAAVIGRKLYVFGGRGYQSAGVYDLDTTRWSDLSPMSTEREACSAVAIGSYIMIMGGRMNGREILSSVEMYDSEKGTWCIPLSACKPKRSFFPVVLVGKEVFILGRWDRGGAMQSVEKVELLDGVCPHPPKLPALPPITMRRRELKSELESGLLK